MSLLLKKTILAAKIETTVGTAVSLAAADAVFHAFTTSIDPQRDFIDREGQGSFSRLSGVFGGKGGQARFMIEATPGSGALPAWATTFLPACGLVATGDVYAPVTNSPGNGGVKTITIGKYENGRYKQLRGCMGNMVIRATVNQRLMLDFTFTGIWDDPTDVTMIAPTFPALKPFMVRDAACSWGSYTSLKFSDLSIDLGNVVTLRDDVTDSSGYASAIITDRRVTGTMDPEAELVATSDFYGDWADETERAFSLAFTQGDLGLTIEGPNVQLADAPTSGDRNGLLTDNLNMQFNKDADAGDDELVITFDHTAA